MTRRSFVVEVTPTVDAAGTTQTYLFGTEGWATRPTDTPANTQVYGKLADPGSVRRALFNGARVTGPVVPDYGKIVLDNSDGAFDFLLDYGIAGALVTVRYGRIGDAYPSAWTTVYVTRAAALVVDFEECSITLRDRLNLLDKPVVTDVFLGTGGLTGTGVATRKQQMVLGRPGFIPPVLVDENRQIYFVQANGSGGGVWTGNAPNDYVVYDGGVALTRGAPYSTAAEGLATAPAAGAFRMYAEGAATDAAHEPTGPIFFRLGSPPEFDIRFSAVGSLKNNASEPARRWTFPDLCQRAGLTDVTASAIAPGSYVKTAGNYLVDADQTYLDVMTDACASTFTAFGFDRLDRLFTLDLALGTEGSDASVFTFTTDNAKSIRRQPVPGQETPSWQVNVQAGKTWPSSTATSLTPAQQEAFRRELQVQFVGTNDSIRQANPGAETSAVEIVGNDLGTLTARKAFLRRWFELFGARRDLITLTSSFEDFPDILDIDLHSKVTVDMPRLGCDGGREFRVITYELNCKARTLTLGLLGGDPGPSVYVLGGGDSTPGGGTSQPPGQDTYGLVQVGDIQIVSALSIGGGSINSSAVQIGDISFLTKLTVAEAGAWNPADLSSNNSATFTNNNNTVESVAGGLNSSGRGITSRSSGKYYFEILVDDATGSGQFVGVKGAGTLPNTYDHATNDATCSTYNNVVWVANSFLSGSGGVAIGDTIGVAVDVGVRIDFYTNNSFNRGAAFTETPLKPYWCGANGGTNEQTTIRTHSADFLYTPPVGYAGWED